jgi:toxin ParE1/3/4
MTNLSWTLGAREELMDVYLMIAADNLSAADRWQSAIEQRTDLLKTHPRLGVRKHEISSQLKMLVHGSYLIFYETHPDTDDGVIEEVEIVSVVDGRQDLSRLF